LRYEKWKASVSRNDRWCATRSDTGRSRSSGAKAEGREGFSFRHREFFLFPTFFHEQIGKVRITARDIPAPGTTIAIRWYAKVERALRINSVAIAEALAPLHILSIEVVRERFGYKGDGLNVAFVRVFEISPVWVLQTKSDSPVAVLGLIYQFSRQ